jgi:hypothetical protein
MLIIESHVDFHMVQAVVCITGCSQATNELRTLQHQNLACSRGQVPFLGNVAFWRNIKHYPLYSNSHKGLDAIDECCIFS